MRLIRLALALGLLAAAPVRAELAPDELVKKTAEEVLAIVRADQALQAGDPKKVLALVEEKVLPHFDFTRMTRLAMGRHWREATPEQQQQIAREFRELLVRTYTAAFTSYKGQSVAYKPLRMEPGATDVTVRTEIVNPDGRPPIPVDYSMYKTPNGWKVYDVTIENVSLVATYRGTFNDEIRRGGIDGLIKSLREKNQGLAQQGPKKG